METAWKIHAALADWTGKVDQKASFALALESAVLVAVIALAEKGRVLSSLAGANEGVFRIGVAVLAIAVVVVMRSVAPQLRRRLVNREWRQNFVFFGHLRNWDAPKLEQALVGSDPLPVLSRQLVVMSKIAWRKHRRLQLSLWLALIGTTLVAGAALEENGAIPVVKSTVAWIGNV